MAGLARIRFFIYPTEKERKNDSNIKRQYFFACFRAPDTVLIFISKMPISSSNPMFYHWHLLESSRRDDSKLTSGQTEDLV